MDENCEDRSLGKRDHQALDQQYSKH